MSAKPTEQGGEASRQVWDVPVRLCHWLLVVSIPAAYVTAELGGYWAEWHGRIGAFVLGLLVFRITWGFLGTTHSRFRDFVPTPLMLRAYLSGDWRGAGHNPLGALAVFAMLFALLFQVSTGLFANDDIAFQGPLAAWVDKQASDDLTGWHHESFDVLLALIGLHLLAIAFYAIVKRTNLVGPMITGHKFAPLAQHDRIARLRVRNVVIATVLSVVFVWGIFGSSLEPTPAVAEPAPVPAAAW